MAGLAATGTIHAHQEKREIHPCNPGQTHRALAKENMHGTHPGKGACPAWMASPSTGCLSNRRIPIILLSSAADVGEWLEGLLHGGVDYVPKPCLPTEVPARVRAHLQLEPTPYRPARCMQLIGENLDALPVLVESAHRVSTHEKKLFRIFRQHLGMTVFGWIREEHLRHGHELLVNSRMGRQGIARQIGFRAVHATSPRRFTSTWLRQLLQPGPDGTSARPPT